MNTHCTLPGAMAAVFLALPVIASAAPASVAVQGRLLAQGAGPVADGNYALAFKLYETKAGGDPLWSEFHLAVAVQGGVFALDLGSVDPKNPLDDGQFLGGKGKWLGVTVGGEPELPRVALHRLPYAMHALGAASAHALECSGCVQAGHLANAAVTSDKIAAGAVQNSHVGFTYAGSDEKGGSAKHALTADAAKIAESAKTADKAASADEAKSAKTADSANAAKQAETAKMAEGAKYAEGAKQADSAKVAESLKCTGCIGAPELADGGVTSGKLAKDLTLQGNVVLPGTLKVGGGPGMTVTNDRQLQHARMHNNDGEPYKCEAGETGALYFDTKKKTLLACDGSAWAPVAVFGTCTDPNADLTNANYPHYGSGNCSPYGSDQTWMSKNDAYAGGSYGWHDSCGKTGPNSWCAIQFPSATKVTRLRVLLHTNPPKNCYFQGSDASSNGVDGAWTSVTEQFDFPSGQEGQWWEKKFANTYPYKFYRLWCPGTPSHALYEWEMFCGG
jgi:hypothetical protein